MHVFAVRENRVFLRLEKGQEAMETLRDFVRERHIAAGTVRAIGAGLSAELAFYNLPAKRYEPFTVDEATEVVSFLGNIGRDQADAPVVHVHALLTRADGSAVGGHLVRLVVGATLEVDLEVMPGILRRRPVPEIGLALQCGIE